MYGREARDVTVIAPCLDGVVADFERTKVMLAHFVRKARSGISHFSRRAIMSVLSGIHGKLSRRALFTAAEQAGIGRVCMIENGLAAALGGGVKMDDTRASAVVDLGESDDQCCRGRERRHGARAGPSESEAGTSTQRLLIMCAVNRGLVMASKRGAA